MAKIDDLKGLNFEKIDHEPIRVAIQNLLDDYKKDGDEMLKDAQENIDKLFKLVKKHAPEAIEVKKEKQNKEGASAKKEKKSPKKELSEEDLKELELIEAELTACRASSRENTKRKKEIQGEPTKPVKKTRYTKLKERMLGLASLIPDPLKEDVETLQATEKILLGAFRDLIKVWGMNKVTAKKAEKAIKEKFDQLEEKAIKED